MNADIKPGQWLWLVLRTELFYLGFILITAFFSFVVAPLVIVLPLRPRFAVLNLWNRLIIGWARIACGIRYRVIGLENRPDRSCVILSKHQSAWETFFLQRLFNPTATILKKELLQIPAFGWSLRLTDPIAIDRSQPREAARQILKQGQERLSRGISVLLFPEGTRMAPGEQRRYNRGGAGLALAAGVPILPVAHNAGVFWPSGRHLKYPGEVTVVIGQPIETAGRDSASITRDVEAWIEAQVAEMPTQWDK